MIIGEITEEAVEVVIERPEIDRLAVKERLRELISLARERSVLWHKMIDSYDRDFYLENTGDDNPDTSAEKKARFTDIPDNDTLAKNILVAAGYRIELDRPGELEPDKKKAGVIESYLRSILKSAQVRGGVDLQSRAVEYAIRFGAAFLHWVYSADPELDELGPPMNQAPIEIFVIDPRRVYPMVDETSRGQFRYVIYHEEKSLAEVYDFVEGTLGGDEMALDELNREFRHIPYRESEWHRARAPFYDYWGWERVEEPCPGCSGGGVPVCQMCHGKAFVKRWRVVNAIMFGEALIRPFTPMYGYRHLPWAMAACRDTGHTDYEKRWLPFHYHGIPHVRRAERIQGRMDAIWTKIANMPYVGTLSATAPQPPEIQGGEKDIIWLQEGQSFTPPPYNTLPRDLYPQLELTQDRLERSMFPRAMFGIGMTAASGYAYDQLQEGGRLRLIDPRNHLAFAFQQLFRGVSALVADHAPDKVVYATYLDTPELGRRKKRERVILTGADLDGWSISVEWSADLPNDAIRKTGQAVQIKQMKLLSDETIMSRYLGVEDPVREQDAILKEQVKQNHPLISDAYAKNVLIEQGALPDITPAKVLDLALKLNEIYAEGIAAGLTPEQAQERVDSFRLGVQMGMMNAMPGMMPGMPGAGMPGMPGQAGMPGQVPGQQPGPQGMRPETGMQSFNNMGNPPPGNPGDPGLALVQLANSMRGNTGEEQ